MRFCVITRYVGFNDGQGRVNFEIAAEAARLGHHVVIFAEEVSRFPEDANVTSRIFSPPSWLPTRLLRDQLFACRTSIALVRQRHKFDAVLGNGFVTWARCDLNAVHFVHASWLQSVHHPWQQRRRSVRAIYARIYNGVNTVLERHAFRKSSRLIAVSRAVASDLRRYLDRSDRVTVIPNGVDTREFHPGPADRAMLHLPQAVPLALFAGDLRSPRKNLDTVLEALAKVPDLHLAIAGREEGTPYPEITRRLGISDRVHFLGFRRDMPALMRASDLFVFPSRYEACSLVLLEALASGTPVVTARSAGGSELVEPQAGIVLENSDDAELLAATLRSLVANEERRREMSAGARALAERYTWRVMAQHYVDLLVGPSGEGSRLSYPDRVQSARHVVRSA